MFNPQFRYNCQDVKHQAKLLLSSEYFSVLLEEIPNVIMVVNTARQVIYANRAFVDHLQIGDGEDIWGKRPGECLDCVRAMQGEFGCGSTEHCSVCGFANMLSISEKGRNGQGECNILDQSGQTLSYSVFTKPFDFMGKPHIFCYLQDVSDKRAQQFLERAFLHDIQNSVSVLYAMNDILDDLEPDEIKNAMRDLSRKIGEEVNSYRIITQAESNALYLRKELLDADALIEGAVTDLKTLKIFRGRQTRVTPGEFRFRTDKALLRRIVLNLLKNAMEASQDDQPIEVWSEHDKTTWKLHVKSQPVMPREVQLQLFQKSFSTKGRGRGWGTYSIRLLTEKYLKGKVSFTSMAGLGTIFTIELPLDPLDVM